MKINCKATLKVSGKSDDIVTTVSKLPSKADYDLLLNNGMKFYFSNKNEKSNYGFGVKYAGKVKYMDYGRLVMNDCVIEFCDCVEDTSTTGKKKDCGCK